MTREEYRKAMLSIANMIKRPAPTYEQKAVIVEILKDNPNIKIAPATDNEIGAIINYLNNIPSKEEFTLGVKRYKDVILCPTYEDRTKYEILTRDTDEQLNDFIERLQADSELEYVARDMNKIYTIKG